MCFSAEADFVSGAVIGAVGVATLSETRSRRELPLAVLPLAFALHQATEGVVWLGLEGHVPHRWADLATQAYLLFAWVLLPLLIPLGVWLVEPNLARRRWMLALMAGGSVVGAYLLWSMSQTETSARIVEHTIQYRGAGNLGNAMTVLYVAATCGAFLLSSHRRIAWFGVANLVAVLAISWYRADALTSLWCIWGAIASVLVYLHFADARRSETTQVGAHQRVDPD